jgi:carbamoyl-phosphate synthase large subunit
MEVVRDKVDNCIIICSIENLDPMGVHTGDSITVAPAQTLTDKEYQIMRDASIACLREIGVETGGSNVQFAINPADGRMVIIEMNPRVSRSSALASKATGFPIAKIAAKLAVGYTLDELKNDITGGATPASFEPTIDYVVTKVPRFAFEKFPQADDRLTTQMKSVGEVMAIGRNFQESLQKALRGLETGVDGFNLKSVDMDKIEDELAYPRGERLWYVADAFGVGMSLADIQRFTQIDPWFLVQIKDLVDTELEIEKKTLADFSDAELRALKRKGFSDRRLAYLWKTNEHEVRKRRHAPASGRSTSASTPARRSSRPARPTCTRPTTRRTSRSRRTGRRSWCSGGGPTASARASSSTIAACTRRSRFREDGYETIMVNCNPETVSTDYDTSDRLYFEPLTLEDVLEIVDKEKPAGVIVQFGGQTPLKLARDLEAAGVPIIGTSPDSIDRAEDRERFQKMLHELKLLQPPNRTARTEDEALQGARTSATRSSFVPRTCSAAARWRSSTPSRTCAATCARP